MTNTFGNIVVNFSNFSMRSLFKVMLLGIFVLMLVGSCKKNGQNDEEKPRAYIRIMQRGSLLLRTKGMAPLALDYVSSIYSARKNHTDIEQYYYYVESNYCYKDLSDWHNAIKYTDSALVKINALKNPKNYEKDLIRLNVDKAVFLMNLRLYSKAAFALYAVKSQLDTIDRKNYNFALYNIYSCLGSLSYNQERFGSAVQHYKRALDALLQIRGEPNILYQVQSFHNNIGFAYFKLHQTDSAITYYNKALYILQHQLADSKSKGVGTIDWRIKGMNEGMIYGNRAKAYAEEAKLQQAVRDYKENVRINNRPGFNIRDANFAQLDLAGVFLKLGHPDSARLLLDQVKPITYNDKDINRLYQKINAQYLNSIGKYRDAYKSLSDYYQLKLAADTNFNKLKSVDFSKEFENFEQDVQIDDYKKKSEIRQILLFGAVIFGLMATIILLVVIRGRKRERKTLLKIVEFNNQLSLVVSSLEQRNQEYSELMSILAHDLYGPLTTITHSAETFLLDVPPGTEDFKLVKAIKNSGTHMIAVIESILNMQKITDGKSNDFNPTNVNELLNDSIALMGYSARSKNITIVYSSCPDCFVLVKREDLWRIVNNLINNAIKFSYEGSRILISLSANDIMVAIKIQDFGIGIPEELKEQLFQIFSTASRTGTAAERSFGLGLYIVKQITAVNHGKIGFSSNAGEGTTFFVQFPRIAHL